MTSAIEYLSNRLRFETDVSDVQRDLSAGTPGYVLIDTRNTESWERGHLPGAIHLPTRDVAARAPGLVPAGSEVVVYCWGPGCNGATKAALEFARLGYPVREMLGGYEYWVREGFADRPADPLTAPVGVACGC